MTQGELAEAANLNRRTINMFEAGTRTPYARSLDAIRKALERAGCQFIPENGGGAGVRLRKKAVPKTPRAKAR